MSLSRLINWIPAVAWASAIWYLSSQPVPSSPLDIPDYLSHALEYGLLGGLVWRGLTGRILTRPAPWVPLALVAICTGYGLTDELHQGFVPGRDPSISDVAADTVGSILAAGGLWVVGSAFRRRKDGPQVAELPVLTLLSRSDCHLCHEAEKVLKSMQREVPFRYTTVDVDSDDEMRARYGEELPVVLMGQKKIFKYRIDPVRLRRMLQRAK